MITFINVYYFISVITVHQWNDWWITQIQLLWDCIETCML